MKKRAFVSKKLRKLSEGECRICGEDTYELLDVHRIKEGSDGGKYSYDNVVCICTSCHRKHHSGLIKVFGWVNSTAGRLLHMENEKGEERFL